jgi:hypothetical protein
LALQANAPWQTPTIRRARVPSRVSRTDLRSRSLTVVDCCAARWLVFPPPLTPLCRDMSPLGVRRQIIRATRGCAGTGLWVKVSARWYQTVPPSEPSSSTSSCPPAIMS